MTYEGEISCDGLVRGDFRSPNGGNRVDLCPCPPKYRITYVKRDGSTEADTHACGRHVRWFTRIWGAACATPLEARLVRGRFGYTIIHPETPTP